MHHADIGRATGNRFLRSFTCSNCLKCSQCCHETSIIKVQHRNVKQKKKKKKQFRGKEIKKIPKSLSDRNSLGQTNFSAVNLVLQ